MRRRANTHRTSEAPGQESFLDIVANLVGILIILIMVIGMRAQDAMVDAAPVVSQPKIDVRSPRVASAALEADIHHLSAQMQREQFEIEYRRKERDRIHLIVRAAEQQLAEQRAQLDAEQQTNFDRQAALAAAQRQLEELERAQHVIAHAVPESETLRHLPTPMAKTVFGKELHFRLEHGRLKHVPWEDFIERLQVEAPNHVWKLKDQDRMTETIGPVEGFWMKYTLRRVERPVQTRAGVSVQQTVELENFSLIPVGDDGGESVAEAMQQNSELSRLLSNQDPKRTTITVWVYPDAFGDFRSLKEHLFQRGYLTAGRPLPEDHPIGGSPEGSRSAVQ